ncbi:MAG: hypothetical protein IT353_23325 [Gemmatimonadaceae bacterium]|nr:hypothetical protein [Gemmatimonadaceae bacterium]
MRSLMRSRPRHQSQSAVAQYSSAGTPAWSAFVRAGVALLSAFALVTLVACGDTKSDSALANDTALGRDLALAAADSNVQPKLQDVPAPTPPVAEPAPVAAAPVVTPPAPRPKPTPRPTTPAPAPKPSAPAPAAAPAAPSTGVIAAGTAMSFATSSKVCSNTTKAGERFSAQLASSVSGSNGVTIPAGAVGTFEVTESRTAKNSGDTTYLRVRLVAVTHEGETYSVNATINSAQADRVRSASKGTDAKKVAGGAVIGAIAGQIIGKGAKGTVIGAAAGAAAGTAAASATADYDTCMNSGATIAVTLDSPVTIKRVSE